MELRVIRDESQYAALLEEAKELALSDPAKGEPAADRLEVISLLLQKYEESRFFIDQPDPIDAIVYRLAELGLKQKDFAEIIGSRSRASEVLARKRPLTLDMIRTIHERLRIPADILIGASRSESTNTEVEWGKFPIKEMQKRGWLDADLAAGMSGEDLIRSFFSRTSVSSAPVLLRRSLAGGAASSDHYALYAWIARVLIRARELKRPEVRYVSGSITDEFLQQLAKLSRSDQGPLLAQEFLAMKGVVLVIEPHLPKTHLDGAAMLDEDGTPVVGLTLRRDQRDYFWFTLMHELVHVQRHLGRQGQAFVDDTDSENDDKLETEANILAAEAFIPRHLWKSSDAYRVRRADAINALANSLMIHPSIVAGRIRRETGNYRILKEFFAPGNLKRLFGVKA
jgi:HTH-type transcriptional regulator/antitoxin HigA